MSGPTAKLARRCWWCNGKLAAVAHAEIAAFDGNTVWVHKVCVADAEEYVREPKITAQPTPQRPTAAATD